LGREHDVVDSGLLWLIIILNDRQIENKGVITAQPYAWAALQRIFPQLAAVAGTPAQRNEKVAGSAGRIAQAPEVARKNVKLKEN